MKSYKDYMFTNSESYQIAYRLPYSIKFLYVLCFLCFLGARKARMRVSIN